LLSESKQLEALYKLRVYRKRVESATKHKSNRETN
jgi:hypothetical protein